jgi:large subunit ribosomal protein L15
MPLYQRLPKRGFNSRNSKKLLDQVNLGSIQKLIDAKKIIENEPIDIAVLHNVGLINKNAVSVKLLAKGALTSKIKIVVTSASEKAKKAVENMGGELNLVSS